MSKILVIEDNELVLNVIENILGKEYEINTCKQGMHGLVLAERDNPEMIILDIMLPDTNGYDICKKIRKYPERFGNPFILILTSKKDTKDVVFGFDIGADDYLKKPFEPEELLSRVKALFRRNATTFSNIIKYKDLIIEKEAGVVKENGVEIPIHKKEFEVLMYFVLNKGLWMSREKVFEDIWQSPYYQENRTIDVYICKLKDKLSTFRDNLISEKGKGYFLNK